MSNLYVAVTGADEDTQRRAVAALEAAGIEVYRSWLEQTISDDQDMPYTAIYLQRGGRVEEGYLTLERALGRLWDLWCNAEGLPEQVVDSSGRVVATEDDLVADRGRRSEAHNREVSTHRRGH